MQVSAAVNIILVNLEKFGKDIQAQLNGADGPVQDAIQLWAVRYRSWSQLRFDLYSRGGGDWQKLALSTIKRRRHGTKSNVLKLRQILAAKPEQANSPQPSMGDGVSILRDTGLLFAALAPIFAGAPGALQETIHFGIRVGYGGPQRHIKGGKQARATIADIASFHQNGNLPRLPQREIIVDPPEELLETMADDMTKALNKLATQ